MQLQTLIHDFAAGFGYELFCHSAELGCIGCASVQFPCRLAQKGARGLEFDLHIRQPPLQPLKLINGLSKGFALAHVRQCCINRRLCRAQ